MGSVLAEKVAMADKSGQTSQLEVFISELAEIVLLEVCSLQRFL